MDAIYLIRDPNGNETDWMDMEHPGGNESQIVYSVGPIIDEWKEDMAGFEWFAQDWSGWEMEISVWDGECYDWFCRVDFETAHVTWS